PWHRAGGGSELLWGGQRVARGREVAERGDRARPQDGRRSLGGIRPDARGPRQELLGGLDDQTKVLRAKEQIARADIQDTQRRRWITPCAWAPAARLSRQARGRRGLPLSSRSRGESRGRAADGSLRHRGRE